MLDLSRTSYVGSAFLDVILKAGQIVHEHGGRMILAGVQPFCAEVLHAAQLDTMWELHDTVEGAATALEKS